MRSPLNQLPFSSRWTRARGLQVSGLGSRPLPPLATCNLPPLFHPLCSYIVMPVSQFTCRLLQILKICVRLLRNADVLPGYSVCCSNLICQVQYIDQMCCTKNTILYTIILFWEEHGQSIQYGDYKFPLRARYLSFLNPEIECKSLSFSSSGPEICFLEYLYWDLFPRQT